MKEEIFLIQAMYIDIPAIDFDIKYNAFYHRRVMKQYCDWLEDVPHNETPRICGGFCISPYRRDPDSFSWRDLDDVPHMSRYDRQQTVNIEGQTYVRYTVYICSLYKEIFFTSHVRPR